MMLYLPPFAKVPLLLFCTGAITREIIFIDKCAVNLRINQLEGTHFEPELNISAAQLTYSNFYRALHLIWSTRRRSQPEVKIHGLTHKTSAALFYPIEMLLLLLFELAPCCFNCCSATMAGLVHICISPGWNVARNNMVIVEDIK